jgi:hypothetical protein
MPNTTNFNFPTPADTDLVKDGALAIRNLGNSIDTAFVDLKGGTSGQVLSKNSNTDLDFAWVAQDDSNAIQNAIIDAKGDLIVGTAADTPARLASSASNGDLLTVDTSTASGLKWAAPASSSPASAVASVSTRQSTSSTTYTNLTTSGPAVTLTTGTKVLVIVSAAIDDDNGSGRPAFMDFAVSGATTRAASDTTALIEIQSTTPATRAQRASSAQGITVTAGSNTFTARYKSNTNGDTVFFADRTITVIDLGS